MELTDVIQTEATNHRHIHLYRNKNSVWGCCEHSSGQRKNGDKDTPKH